MEGEVSFWRQFQVHVENNTRGDLLVMLGFKM
jgi:hypothetical protein